MTNFKTTPLLTEKEKFYEKFSKPLVTWNETEAGPEPDERLLNAMYETFDRHREDIEYLDSDIFKKIAEFFK